MKHTTDFLNDKPLLDLIDAKCKICEESNNDFVTVGYDYEYFTCANQFKIYRCRNDGLLYLASRPQIEDYNVIYPDNYYAYDFESNKGTLAKWVKKRIELNKIDMYKKLIGDDGSVLDVGCGDGRLLALFNKNGQNWDLYGIDFNANAIKLASETGITTYFGKFEEVELPQKKFDLIIMNQVLEHATDPRHIIEKVEKILKPGGYLIVETPNINSLDFHLFKNKYFGGYHFPRHFYLFTEENLKILMEACGLGVVNVSYMVSPPFWILSFHNMLLDMGWSKPIVEWFNIFNPILLGIFTLFDFLRKPFQRTSNMRVIARKHSE